MKRGGRVEYIGGLEGYAIADQLDIGGIYTIERVKSSGGLILREVDHPTNVFGEIQGIQQHRFRPVQEEAHPPESDSQWIPLDDIVAILQDPAWSWIRNSRCKYVGIHIDTRDCRCLVKDRFGNELTLEELEYQYRRETV